MHKLDRYQSPAAGFCRSLTALAAALCVLLTSPASSQAQLERVPVRDSTVPLVSTETSLQILQRDLLDIFEDPNFSNAFWGVSIHSLETGQTIFRYNDTRSFLPASNLKLFTSAAALTSLSPEFRFNTQLLTAGKVVGNVLKGDLILRGAGDPTLGSQALYPDSPATFVFESWAEQLDKMGIARVEGSIIGDDSYFTEDIYPMGWAIEDMPYYYAMQTTALAFAENSVSATVTPGSAPGDRVQLELIPVTDYLEIDNRATTKADSLVGKSTAGKDSVIATGSTSIHLTREPGTNTITVSGEIPQSSPALIEQLSVEDPTRYAVSTLREALESRGIEVSGKTTVASELKTKLPYLKSRVLAQYSSPPLSEIVRVMNKRSNNLYAEMLFRTLGKEREGEGSWRKGRDAMKQFLSTVGIAPERMAIYDGSGLSRMDLASPAHFVTLLKHMYQKKNLFEPFYASLPIMGVDGTLANRLKDTRAQGNVRAKTGFLTGVRSISGYLTTRDNELLAFSIIGNNYTTPVSLANNLQDLVILRLVNFSRK